MRANQASSDLARGGQPQTIPALFESTVRRHGDRLAVVADNVRWTYRDLDHARLEAARAFIGIGLRKGDAVAIWAPNIPEYVVIASGLQSVGGILVPINTRFKRSEACSILERSRARFLFTVDEFLGIRYPELIRGANLPDLERVVLLRGGAVGDTMPLETFLESARRIGESELNERSAQLRENDVLDYIFTSGTTGKPKAAISTHGKTLRTYHSFTAQTTLNSQDRYLIINPFFHTFGYKYGWLSCVMRGACMLPMQVFDATATLELIHAEHVTLIPGPPTIYQSLLAHTHRSDYNLSSLRFGQTGAASIPVELIRSMYRDLKLQFVLTGYGLTESCGIATTTQLDDDPEIVATTVGRACDGVEIRIVSADGRELPTGEPGEVMLRGDNVMIGYLDEPEATASAIETDGFLHTGDIGTLDANGRLRITDRLKDMIIVGGFKCYPAEVENVLVSMPGIMQAAVIGIPDERLGEVAKAFLVAKSGQAPSDEAVIAWCRERISNFKVPRQVEFVSQLPMNASGKVLKTQLRVPSARRLP